MPRVIIIGTGLAKYGKSLRAKGHTVKAFKGTPDNDSAYKSADIIIVDGTLSDNITDLKKATKELPKIVLTSAGQTGRRISWIREPMAHIAHGPTPAEVLALVTRALAESAKIKENRKLSKTLLTLQAELDIFEELNSISARSSDISTILPAIMKQSKKITNAESWSVHLVNSDTGELTCAKTSGRLGKACSSTLHSVATWTTKQNKPVLIKDISSDTVFGKNAPSSCKNRKVSIIATPIVTKTSLIGSMELLKSRKPFTMDDLDFFSKLSRRSALALERITLQQRLEELVVTDDLTNLFNTRYLNRSIENEMHRSKRYGHAISVIFMDVDHFKKVNDTHGHLVGSKVLVEMAEILIRELRNIDIVARYGGDEFVMVLPQTTLQNAMAIAERIRGAIESNIFLESDGMKMKLTASFGVAAYPESASNKEEVMRIADESMYSVKKHTRNGVYAIIKNGTF